MKNEEIVDLCKKHTMWSWSAGDNVAPLAYQRAEGIYFYTADGKRYIDWNSQLMSVLIGHSHPKVIERMKKAAEGLIFAHPAAATEIRGRVGEKLSKLVPGDINTFFFTLGGAEANENALKAARLFTGRQKVMSWYRSYHGATNGAMMLTGDPRRLANEPGGPGYIKLMSPDPYEFSFGKTDEEKTDNHLKYLEEVIQYEGKDKIAALFIESVIGTNGILPPPKGYLAKLKPLLEKYGILLVCDEVMAGFGRTGKMFGFEHGGIVPDIVTMAKGLTSSYVPLGAMGVSDRIAEHFRKNVFWGGLTYNAHPFCLEVADAVIDVLLEEKLVDNAAKLEPVMAAEMAKLKEKHPSVKTHRNTGLFGLIELQKDKKGTPMAPYGGSHPVMPKFAKALQENGLWTVLNWWNVMNNPPLCITEAQLKEGFAIVDKALAVTDEVVEG
ncbi:MAG: aminotransferase class III-fold pyridoxal phosphate-dependent enzyme [Polyangiaceae bacterium]